MIEYEYMTDPLQIALGFIKRGWNPVPVSRQTSTTQYGPGSGLVIEKLRARAIAARSLATRQ